ncbi:MAG: hypothetical protein IJV06_10015 [Bacteroidaceae bacterium]|nr:hypothetical protein [Bacteroidaceae bacterium]
MRRIVFRAQDIASNKWLYGDLRHHKDDVCIFEQGGTKGEQVKRDTVGQFTSLYDKNGKEIFEGDILKVGGCRQRIEVRFVRGVFAFLWDGNLDDEFPTGSPTQEWAEVIGNIHDNPELIKQPKGNNG